MAYEKQNWVCGDTLTADKLNHMEDGIANASEGGFSCTEAYTLLTDETVTTEAEGDENVGTLSYTSQITADTLRVTFNDTVYDCPKQTAQGATLYGGWSNGMPDFSVFPFTIGSTAQDNRILTSTAGTYTVKLEEDNSTVTTTKCFQKAVKSVVDADSNRVIVTVIGNSYGSITDASHSPQEVWNDVLNDKDVILKFYHSSSVDDYTLYRPVKVNFGYGTSEVTGRAIRFQSEISWDEQQSELLQYPIDILLDSSSNNYYWVYNEYWNGRYPQGV